MHPQLIAIEAELLSAQERLHRLHGAVPGGQWAIRPAPERWSVGECVAHLNLTAIGYRPILTAALQEAAVLGGPTPKTLRRDLLGWLLWKSMPPPVRGKTKTMPEFIPEAGRSASELVAEFDALQVETLTFLRASDGLAIQRVRITSPFSERIRYNLFACFSILAAHQHRHLWQAEQVRPSLGLQ